jgi:uncharacterized protein
MKMIPRKTHLFAVPVCNQWLVHAPLHEITALINEPAWQRLRNGEAANDDDALGALHAALSEPPLHNPQPLEGPLDPKFLAIVTTRGCNIHCVYCDFGGPTSSRVHLDHDLAVEAIDWFADQLVARGRKEFFVHFFGGEPFISEDLVEVIVHRTRAVCAARGLRPFFDASTNGVFSEARADWIGQYFDSIVLSFDGPPEFQNRNRPARGGRPTYEAVARTAERLSRAPIELCLRVCITGESVHRMEEMVRWMTANYRPAVINFEPLTENDLTADAELTPADPYDFARNWMSAKHVADELGVRLVYSATESETPRLTSCPVGTDALVVTPDGQVNACYLQSADWLKHGMDMHLGSIEKGTGLHLDSTQVERARHVILDKPRCSGCLCQWSCAGGCHVSNTYRNCPTNYVGFCQQTRLLTVCLLLEQLGAGDVAKRLLDDPDAARRLAMHEKDTWMLPSSVSKVELAEALA